MTDLTLRIGAKAFHCPRHDVDMSLHRYGMEPRTMDTYGIWRCPDGGELWFESEGAEAWEEWEDD